METFWAKTPMDRTITPDWENIHSVLHHCIDVGLVAETLLEKRWKSIREILRRFHTDVDMAVLIVVVLAAAHDIGKITWWFQSKVDSLYCRLRRAGFGPAPGTVLYHGQATCFFLAQRLESDWLKTDTDLIGMCAQASGCHHGTFFNIADSDLLSDGDRWAEQRNLHFSALVNTWFPGRTTLPEPEEDNPGPEWTMLVAGLISVADWVGSSLPFPAAVSDQVEYLDLRRRQVHSRLQETGLLAYV